MKQICLYGALLQFVLLQGCAGVDDATLAVNSRGPVAVYPNSPFQQDGTLAGSGRTVNPNSVGIFVDAYKGSLSNVDDHHAAYEMAVDGYDLVDHNCNVFFQAGGENQKWLDLSKDLVAALGTLGTGIAAVAGSSATVTPVLALTTAGAYNGIDIYTRNFLFGAANISSVRTLITNALAVHRKNTIGADNADQQPWTFNAALLQIEDHQAICQSAKIRELVLQAISGGTIQP